MKIELLNNYTMEIPEEYESLITTDDIDWCHNRLTAMTGVIVCGGRGSKHQILKNIWELITKDLINGDATLVDLQGFKSWFFIRKEIKLSSVFRKVMEDWYTVKFANKEVSVELYNELLNDLFKIHTAIKKFDHRHNNWGTDKNGRPVLIDGGEIYES